MTKLHPKQIIILGLVTTIIILIIFLLTNLTKPTPNITDTSVPEVTVSPSIYPSTTPTTPPVDTVDLSNIETPKLPTSSPTIKVSVTKFTISSAQKLAETLQFTGTPTSVKSTVNPLVSWNNPNYNLTINLNTSQIVLGNLTNAYIATINGSLVQNPTDLTQKAISLIQGLNIFDPKLSLVPSTVEYFKSRPTYYEPTTQDEAHLITINLVPTLDKTPIFLENKQFIKVTYDLEGKLIKFIINYPLGQISKTSPISLLTFEEIKTLSPNQFFVINISPENISEYYLSPPPITSISPNQILFGYVFKFEDNLLNPVFVVEKTENNNLRYQFAVPATKN